MAHDAEHGCADGEPNPLLGDHDSLPPLGPANRLRWVCGASAGLPAGPVEGLPGRPGVESGDPAERADLDPRVAPGDQLDATRAADPAARSGRGAGSDEVDRSTGSAEPERGRERSRLIPRPRPGEPGRPAAAEPGRLGIPEEVGEATGSAEGSGGAPDDEADDVDCRRTPGCQTDRPGWAGAHRHGAVRPSRRAVRRDRPPRRWC
ncbi:hypothetical protein [Plantactinospora soyae]|uniref:Uncharacterized protein n=1 Tax=Plantactinospora soyae TaxID=1544732 RepID=A0A927R1E8_9ACTN|nr:hypothetical protein [Plantactinospora soyae]MBE1492645.1 hypothetical protein [Plantactinospora soyae]